MGNKRRRRFKPVQTQINSSTSEKKIIHELNSISNDLEIVKNQFKSFNRKSFTGKEFTLSILIAVIATIFSSIIISVTNNVLEQNQYKKSVFDAVDNICIGCSKEWMDSQFGVPTFSCAHPTMSDTYNLSENLSILECCYILDEFVIRAFYKTPGNSCCLFLVTQRIEKMSYEIHIPYSPANGKSLGKFTYYEIKGKPQFVFGFDYQGFVRDLYGELYYFGTSANYFDFIFMTLDYGYIDKNFSIGPYDVLDIFLDDEVDVNQIIGLPMDASRDSVHPNTYGISALSEKDTITLVQNYSTFDSFWPFFEKY